MRRPIGLALALTTALGAVLSGGCVVGGGGPVECPRGYREVDECPENEECKRVQGETETLICEKLTCDTPPRCPIESDRVDECYTGDRCFLRERCGEAIMCREEDPHPCDREPQCPENATRVHGCPKDALCFDVRRCGTEITCKDETAY